MTNSTPADTSHEIIESPYRISWVGVGKYVIPLLILVLIIALWFVYIYIPSNLEQDPVLIPDTKTSTSSADKNSTVNLPDVLSKPTEYSGKNFCMEVYYYQAFEASAILNSFDEQKKEVGDADIWVVNETGKDIVDTPLGIVAVTKIKACGTFKTGESYGHLGVYKHQLTLTSFSVLGNTVTVE